VKLFKPGNSYIFIQAGGYVALIKQTDNLVVSHWKVLASWHRIPSPM